MSVDHEALANTYFCYVNEQAAQSIADLFTPEGMILAPDGKRLSGREEIRDFYQSLFAAGAPAPQLINTVGAGAKMATEMQVKLADGTIQPAADFFDLSPTGLIAELRIYVAAPPARATAI